ncbi:MAG: hypothetical protein ABI542_12170 [Gemmatimonadota bacterium]
MRIIPLAAMLALLALGCSEPPPDPALRDSAQQRQHDSMIGASSLPGASGVNAALRVADSAAARRLREAATSDSQ